MSHAKPTLGYPSRTAAVAALQAQGLSNGDIAAKLGISTSTVTALKGKASKPSTRLTSEQIDDLVERRERGWSYQRLARRYGVSPGAVHYQCLKHGAISPRQRRHPVPTEPRVDGVRAGKPQRRFTADEDRALLAFEAQGLSYAEIARRSGRALTSVRIRLMTLALHEEIPTFPSGAAA
ncbi:LuxR C-terminal-related transcriptional regulator [Novosphingobium huizhouense]|uniref:LuxR C-terminal-related transcriptional regulator n=1 Tax=Novosphingobium huizhouense TaxID=2866625 RepID=UPI001CD8A31C|nr:LuxR C-terminal-related transcriptional regulator [Novosphingobium huizhouense]